MDEKYQFTRQGRKPRTVVILIVIYSVLLAAIIVIDAVWWLIAVLALLTLPALWDLWKDPSAGIWLDSQRLDWHSGRLSGSLDLNEIDHMRFDTRWDFSVRVTAVLNTGKRIRLPYESLPPHRAFEATLDAKGIRVERHYFTVL